MPQPTPDINILKTLEQRLHLKHRLRDAGVPSASIALLDSPSSQPISHVITTGPEDTETIYQACSISKAITALGVARLVDQDVLTYDTKVVDHLPREVWDVIVDSKTERFMDYVTIGLLLSHRSGLSQHGFPGYASGPIPSTAEILAGTAPANTPRMKFLSFPGSQCCYSGGGFVLLQILMERITGKAFADLMEELVFKPLDMARSHYGSLPKEESNFAKAHKTAYVLGTDRGYHDFAELAAAGVWTTPSDLLKAVAAIQLSLHDESGFLSQPTARHMLTRTSPPSEGIGHFGMGWGVDDTFFAHSGDNYPGYVTYVIGGHNLSGKEEVAPIGFQRVGQMSLAIMTNSILGEDTLHKLVAAIFEAKGWPTYPSLPCGFGNMNTFVPYPMQDGAALFAEDWEGFVGCWSQSGCGVEYEVLDKGGMPYVEVKGVGSRMRLLPAAIPWGVVGEMRVQSVFVVEGLEMAVRMLINGSGEQEIELVQERKSVLRRV